MGLGTKVSASMYAFEVLFPFAWIAVCSILGIMPMSTIICFLTLPIAMGCGQAMIKSTKTESNIIGDLDVRTANLQLMFSLLLSVAFIASKLF